MLKQIASRKFIHLLVFAPVNHYDGGLADDTFLSSFLLDPTTAKRKKCIQFLHETTLYISDFRVVL